MERSLFTLHQKQREEISEMKKVSFIPWDSRKYGFTPEMFRTTKVFYDPLAEENREIPWTVESGGKENGEIPWKVVSGGKEKTIRTPKEWSSKKQHYYAYVEMIVGDEVMPSRSMSLAELIWLCYLGRSIPAGCVVDHKDENPANNKPYNLQLLSIGDNVKKSWKIKKGAKK